MIFLTLMTFFSFKVVKIIPLILYYRWRTLSLCIKSTILSIFFNRKQTLLILSIWIFSLIDCIINRTLNLRIFKQFMTPLTRFIRRRMTMGMTMIAGFYFNFFLYIIILLFKPLEFLKITRLFGLIH